MNSTLGSVVPLAMFLAKRLKIVVHMFTRMVVDPVSLLLILSEIISNLSKMVAL